MTSQPDLNEPSLLKNKGCWLAFATAIPLLIGLLFWLVEDQAGKRYLAKTKARFAQAGIELDPAKALKALPDAPPDEENFCAIPLLRQIGRGDDTGPQIEALKKLAEWNGYVSYSGTKFSSPISYAATDWAAVHREIAKRDPSTTLPENPENPAAALAQAVEDIGGPIFAELEAALDRPSAMFLPTMKEVLQSPNWQSPPNWMRGCNNLQKVLLFRANLSLANGRTDQTLINLRLLWKLSEAGYNQTSVVGGLMGITASTAAKHLLWQSLRERHFQKAELEQLMGLLSSQAPLKQLPRAFTSEFIYQQLSWKHVRSDPGAAILPVFNGGSPPLEWQRILFGLVPAGWLDFNEGKVLHYQLAWMQHLENTSLPNRFDYENWPGEKPVSRGFLWHDFAAKEWFSTSNFSAMYASDHATNQLARAACALELFFLDQQSYPVSLAELSPTYLDELPLDFDHQPVRYRKEEANGRCKLWSIGLNGTDEGGAEMAGAGGKPRLWRDSAGDWVWRYPRFDDSPPEAKAR